MDKVSLENISIPKGFLFIKYCRNYDCGKQLTGFELKGKSYSKFCTDCLRKHNKATLFRVNCIRCKSFLRYDGTYMIPLYCPECKVEMDYLRKVKHRQDLGNGICFCKTCKTKLHCFKNGKPRDFCSTRCNRIFQNRAWKKRKSLLLSTTNPVTEIYNNSRGGTSTLLSTSDKIKSTGNSG